MTHPRIRAICRLAAASTLAVSLHSCERGPEPPSDSNVVVATVNKAPITFKALKTEIARVRGISPPAAARSGTRTEVSRALRQLVERAVVLEEGERLGVTVSRSEVEEEVQRYRADFPPGGLEKALLEGGIDAQEWREEMRRSILYRKASETIARPLAEVSEQEVRMAYRDTYGNARRPERIRVRQFLFDSPETAAGAREELAQGISPGELGKRFSAAKSIPLDIDLGYLSREELPEEIAPELFGLPTGGVSRIIRRDKMFSVFLVVQRSPEGPYSYAEEAPEIRREMLERRREEAFRAWLDTQIGKAHIMIRENIVTGLMEGRQ
jgi:parvulin-like peptidyl-prolyl isomerase